MMMAPKPTLTEASKNFTVEVVAEQFVLHPNQVRLIIKHGDFPNAWRTKKRGPWRIPEVDVVAYQNRKKVRTGLRP